MLGALVTIVFCVLTVGLGTALFGRWLKGVDPACKVGFAGLLGLGTVSTLMLPIGLMPGGLRWGFAAIVLIAMASWIKARPEFRFAKPVGYEWAFAVAIGLGVLFAFVGALAPSDSLDWDTLAYHLAVPKIWLHDGAIHPISFIHHSNFPLDVDALYLLGLPWGGEAGAKTFSTVFLVLGAVSLFGMARERYGKIAGWWAALAFVGMPVAMWEGGTAYIDVGNGLFVGLAILALARWAIDEADSKWIVLAGLFLGLAAGSKYTGLETIFAACLAVVLIRRSAASLRAAATAAAIGLVVAAPWYVKNVLWTGNPVYPFLYERFGGTNWNQFSSDIYRDEQQSFGVGRTASGHDPMAVGEAILGLAFQPGRYNNPMQTQGMGFPFQALGAAVVASGFVWLLSGKLERFEAVGLVSIGISLALWFFLSQQSRYMIGAAVPLCVMLGGGAIRLRAGPALAALAACQAAYSLWLVKTLRVDAQLPVVVGKVSADDYLAATVPFYEPSKIINDMCKDGTVALYNEVFGYLLDVPYFWANPGHSTQIPYADLQDGAGLVSSYRRLGIGYVYLSFDNMNPDQRQRMAQAMGLLGAPVPYTDSEKASADADIRNKWPLLLADAVATGRLKTLKTFGDKSVRSILFKVN